MQEATQLTEKDLELVNALQVAPRASWEDLAVVLGTHATTLSRRWSRLSDAGLARTSIAPGTELSRVMDFAFVELTCQNNSVQSVVEKLLFDQRLMSLQFVAGPAHLLLTVLAAEHGLADFLLTTIGEMEGVLHYEVRTVTSQIIQASQWHFRALSLAKLRKLEALHQNALRNGEAAATPSGSVDRRIMRALSLDGRASFRNLATEAQITPTAAARKVTQLVRDGYISLRCDVARRGTGRSFSAVLWGSIRPDKLPAINESLLHLVPALRMMATVTGANNVYIIVWLNDPIELLQVEQQLLDAVSGLTIDNRRIILRTFKYNGATLNRSGTFDQIVPMNY